MASKGEVEVPTPLRLLIPEAKLGVGGQLLVVLLRTVSLVYDAVTLPIYWWKQEVGPSERLKRHRESKALEVDNVINVDVNGDREKTTWRTTRWNTPMHRELENLKVDTMDKVFALAVDKNGLKRCLGTRELLNEEDEVQPNGKVFKKYVQGDYLWKSYSEVDRLALAFCAGLTSFGLKPGDKLCIFAETRAEWMIAAIAAFKNNFQIVTLYATLGEDAVVHGLTETETTVVLTSHDLLPKFKSILGHAPRVRHLIYMEHPLTRTDVTGYSAHVTLHPFSSVVNTGQKLNLQLARPAANDVAIIMYTSGSTGVPKGVLLSHKNVATAMMGLCDGLGQVFPEDIYIGYLPLAHVLELMCESICFLNGVPIGYSSPLTITSKSSKIKEGHPGDAVVLQPTIMVSVPFALDRIYKGIQEQIREGGTLKRALFYFFYDYKLKWYYAGWDSPLVNRIIMKKPRMIVGGRVRIIITGGAPLAEDTHEFVRNCLSLPLVQGYGLTETSACSSCSTPGDMSTGRVGPPLKWVDMRLVNWDEGAYFVRDKPCPRGELVIGGDNVALGYFKLPDATAADFFVENGKRWFRTGDIAEVDEDGVFRVIDRKKDLVKLQMGEYLSLGKVESALKTSPYVDTICMYADPKQAFAVALVVPVQKQLELLAASLHISAPTFDALCQQPRIVAAMLKEISTYASLAKLQRFEIPLAITLYPEPWTPETNLVTAAFKLRRKNIKETFQKDIDRMYAAVLKSQEQQ